MYDVETVDEYIGWIRQCQPQESAFWLAMTGLLGMRHIVVNVRVGAFDWTKMGCSRCSHS